MEQETITFHEAARLVHDLIAQLEKRGCSDPLGAAWIGMQLYGRYAAASVVKSYCDITVESRR